MPGMGVGYSILPIRMIHDFVDPVPLLRSSERLVCSFRLTCRPYGVCQSYSFPLIDPERR